MVGLLREAAFFTGGGSRVAVKRPIGPDRPVGRSACVVRVFSTVAPLRGSVAAVLRVE